MITLSQWETALDTRWEVMVGAMMACSPRVSHSPEPEPATVFYMRRAHARGFLTLATLRTTTVPESCVVHIALWTERQ